MNFHLIDETVKILGKNLHDFKVHKNKPFHVAHPSAILIKSPKVDAYLMPLKLDDAAAEKRFKKRTHDFIELQSSNARCCDDCGQELGRGERGACRICRVCVRFG